MRVEVESRDGREDLTPQLTRVEIIETWEAASTGSAVRGVWPVSSSAGLIMLYIQRPGLPLLVAQVLDDARPVLSYEPATDAVRGTAWEVAAVGYRPGQATLRIDRPRGMIAQEAASDGSR
jgi:hypothetical protein